MLSRFAAATPVARSAVAALTGTAARLSCAAVTAVPTAASSGTDGSHWSRVAAWLSTAGCVTVAAATDTVACEPVEDEAELYRHPRLIPLRNDLLRRRFYETVKAYPDFPKPGIMFQDVFPIFQQPALVKLMVEALEDFVRGQFGHVDVVVGLDSRGFLFGPMLAMALGCKFTPVRKKGKLPGDTIGMTFTKEYGEDTFEVAADALQPGARVIIVDDLLATGGSMSAGVQVVEKAGGKVVGTFCIVELVALKGSAAVMAPCYSLLRL